MSKDPGAGSQERRGLESGSEQGKEVGIGLSGKIGKDTPTRLNEGNMTAGGSTGRRYKLEGATGTLLLRQE